MEALIAGLAHPISVILLALIVFVSLFIEIKIPGIGLPTAVAVAAATLLFWPQFVLGNTEVWEVVLFAVGMVLIALEVTVIPGTGAAGIIGLVCAIGGIVLALLPNKGLNFSAVSTSDMWALLTQMLLTFIAALLGVFWLGRNLIRSKRVHPIVSSESISARSTNTALSVMVGLEGVTSTDLRPAGLATFGDHQVEVHSTGAYIPKGSKVQALRYESNHLMVEAIPEK